MSNQCNIFFFFIVVKACCCRPHLTMRIKFFFYGRLSFVFYDLFLPLSSLLVFNGTGPHSFWTKTTLVTEHVQI